MKKRIFFSFLLLHSAMVFSFDYASLYESVEKDEADKVFAFLGRDGVDINEIPDKNENLLIYSSRVRACETGAKLLARYYKGEAFVSLRNEAFWEASAAGSTCLVKHFLDSGVNINFSKSGANSLYFSLENGNLDVANLLIKKGVDLFQITESGETMLFAAALSGDKETAKFLIESGVSVSSRNKEGRTALDFARYKWDDQSQIVEFLKQQNTLR